MILAPKSRYNGLTAPMNKFTKKDLEYLAGLSRIRLEETEEANLLVDLQNILSYVAELSEVNTEGVAPMNGGTLLTDVLRDDEARKGTLQGHGADAFPVSHQNQMEIPPVLNK